MPNSINGWPVLDNPPWSDPRLAKKPIPGVPNRTLTLRAEVLPLFLALAKDYHDTIAPVDEGALDDWSYGYRAARAASAWSDHASGTAIDLNASKEGWLGMSNYSWWANPARHQTAQAIKKRYEVVMWGGSKDFGGDYFNGSTVDWMHWAIKPGVSVAQVQDVIKRLGIDANGNRPQQNDALDNLLAKKKAVRERIDRREAAGKPTEGLRGRLGRLKDRIKDARG